MRASCCCCSFPPDFGHTDSRESLDVDVCGITMLSLFGYAVSRYLPRHIEFLGERAKFYLFGDGI